MGIEIKFYYLDTFKKQIDLNFIDLESDPPWGGYGYFLEPHIGGFEL